MRGMKPVICALPFALVASLAVASCPPPPAIGAAEDALCAEVQAALADLDLALERSPRHVGALSGKALTLMGLGRADEAQAVLREALALNPWIPERGLLQEAPGEEL